MQTIPQIRSAARAILFANLLVATYLLLSHNPLPALVVAGFEPLLVLALSRLPLPGRARRS